jgi:putative aldouronate transport system permease protein
VQNSKMKPKFTSGIQKTRSNIIIKDIVKNRYVYLMLLPVVAYFLLFWYGPMYGALIAFKDFSPGKGIWGSTWVGFRHFTDFFNSYYFTRLLRNTLLLNFYDILFGFPAPIALAILINEIRSNLFKRTVQTISYMPHFISLVVVCGLITDFAASDGVFNSILSIFGIEPIQFLLRPEWFRTIYVSSEIWRTMGWSSIIYLAALVNIPLSLYEAAELDGAGRLRKIMNITIPGILPTIVIMLIMRIGKIMQVGVEKVMLLYNPATYETADVISTFVYRKGILEMSFSYSTAVGLFNSVISFILVYAANTVSRKVTDSSLW